MTAWAHNRTERNRTDRSVGVGNGEVKHPPEKLDPPRDWMDAFLLKRITADPTTTRPATVTSTDSGWFTQGTKVECAGGPNNLDSCRHLINRLDSYRHSSAPDQDKMECLRLLLQLAQSAQEKESRRFLSPETDSIDGLWKAVRQNFMDMARHSTVHSGRTRLAFETSDNLERARTIVYRFRKLS